MTSLLRAHPRSRGENWFAFLSVFLRSGSSPLTRGKLSSMDEWNSGQGLIPAHAGKTWRCGRTPAGARAHPRSRGENSSWDHNRTMFRGSSPLTRGKRVLPGLPPAWWGLIPAHAGKTASAGTGPDPPGAHPRSRGENIHVPCSLQYGRGSSPLTRGKLPHRECGEEGGRLIPAHAGKTWP